MVGRILRFMEKAKRHYLEDDVYNRIDKEIDQFMSQSNKYQVNLLARQGVHFCPEYLNETPEMIPPYRAGGHSLFGPANMPSEDTLMSPVTPPRKNYCSS